MKLQEWNVFFQYIFFFRYGKYKPLTQPGKCITCSEKKVRFAYHIICGDCVESSGNCAKCNKPEDIVNTPQPTVVEAAKLDAEIRQELKALPERKRRTFLRYLKSQEKSKPNSIRFYL